MAVKVFFRTLESFWGMKLLMKRANFELCTSCKMLLDLSFSQDLLLLEWSNCTMNLVGWKEGQLPG